MSVIDDLLAVRPAQDLPRSCGSCMACCTALKVDSLDKPAHSPCPHASRGCQIYPSRPEECRTFACLWLQGIGTGADRPDRSGTLLDLVWTSPSQATIRVITMGPRTLELLEEAIAELAQRGVLATAQFS